MTPAGAPRDRPTPEPLHSPPKQRVSHALSRKLKVQTNGHLSNNIFLPSWQGLIEIDVNLTSYSAVARFLAYHLHDALHAPPEHRT